MLDVQNGGETVKQKVSSGVDERLAVKPVSLTQELQCTVGNSVSGCRDFCFF